jgi:uncharacterized membrane protein YedE/YeeE
LLATGEDVENGASRGPADARASGSHCVLSVLVPGTLSPYRGSIRGSVKDLRIYSRLAGVEPRLCLSFPYEEEDIIRRLPIDTTGAAITSRLIVGSAAFGIGWGLSGFCPGPALIALGAGYPKALGFVTAMVAGMVVFELLERAKSTIQRA